MPSTTSLQTPPTGAADTARTIRISQPAVGSNQVVTSVPGGVLQFDFDTSRATFARSGNDLTLTLDAGGKVIIDNFFVVGDQSLPVFELNDGTRVKGDGYLTTAAPDMDITTAAGPTAAGDGSGSGSYADNSGSLLGGVDRLGDLGGIAGQEFGGTDAPLSAQSLLVNASTPAAVFDAGTAGGDTPIAPIPPVPPSPPAPPAPPAPNTVPTISGATIAVDEANLSNGSHPDAAALTKTGSFSLNGNGEAVSLSISDAGGDHQFTFNADGSLKTGMGTVLETGHGELTVTGSSLNADGSISIHYSFTLDAASNNNSVPDALHLTVTDATGDQATADISISIHNDAPWAGEGGMAIDQYAIPAGGLAIHGFIPEFTLGADGPASSNFITLGHPNDLTSDGTVITYTSDGAGHLSGWAGTTEVFSFSVALDGTYTYTQYHLIDGYPPANGGYGFIMFPITMVDGDGDKGWSNIAIRPIGGYQDRFVMYTGSNEADIDGKIITGNVTLNDAGGNTNTLVSVGNGMYGTATVNPTTGEVTYTLLPDAAARMSGTSNALVVDHVAYTARDANGVEYTKTIEIVIDRNAGGSSLFISPNNVNGETHQNYISTQGDGYSGTTEIQGSDGNDVFKAGKNIIGAEINLMGGDNEFRTVDANKGTYGAQGGIVLSNSTLDMGAGNDRVVIASYDSAAVADSIINLGDGDNSAIITGGTQGVKNSTITAGSGNDTITITGGTSTNGSSGYNSGLHMGSRVDAGDGDNSILVTGTGNGMRGATITAGSGNDLIVVNSSLTNNGSTYFAGMIADSHIDAGDGQNTISINSGAWGMYGTSTIVSGKGDDSITINAVIGEGMVADSSIDSGAGNDTITINAGHNGIQDSAVITTGAGNDLITIKAGNIAVSGGTINLGTGADTVSITGATGMSGGLIDGSADNLGDRYTITGTSGAGMTDGAQLLAGGGDDVITIKSAGPGDVSALQGNSVVNGGGGNDTISLIANSTSGAARGLDAGGKVILGSGNDSLSITAASTSGNAYGVTGTTLDTGAGNDSLNILTTANGGYSSSAYAVSGGAKVLLGDGDNNMTVNAVSTGRYAYGIYSDYGVTGAGRTSVTAGAGDDILDITVKGSSTTVGISNALINLGEGNNKLNITGQGTSTYIYGMETSNVSTGSGNDTVSMTLNGAGAGVYSSTVNLGEGNNLFTIKDAATGVSVSSVTSGSGNDAIIIESLSNTASTSTKYGMSGGSNISTGAGDDLLRVTLAGTSTAQGIYGGTVNMGTGNDTVIIDLTGTSSAGAMDSSANLSLGDGNDLVSISAKAQGSGWLAYGMHNSSRMDLGNGNDTLQMDITAQGSASNYAYGVVGSANLQAGVGDDSVRINTTSTTTAAGATATAESVSSAYVDMGTGSDTLEIGAKATGDNAVARDIYALYSQGYTVSGGSGDDKVTLSATATGITSALSTGIGNATFDAGAGNDTLSITASATGGNATANALQQAKVLMGDGNDVVSLTAQSSAHAYGITNGTNGYGQTSGTMLDLGNGNDSLSVSVKGGLDAYGVYNSSVNAGAGDDSIVITATATSGPAYALYGTTPGGTTLIGGAGSDTITLGDTASHSGGNVMNSIIALGTTTTGADTLGYTDANRLSINGSVTGSAVYGTAGNDRVDLSGGVVAGSTLVGGLGYDILSLDMAGINSMADFTAQYGSLFEAVTGYSSAVQGFEVLEISGTMPAGLADYLDSHGIVWATTSSVDANTFTGQVFGVDYNLSSASALNQDISLSTHFSHDTLNVAGIDGHTVDLGRGWDQMTVTGDVANSSIIATHAIMGSNDMKEISIGGDLAHSTITLGGGHDAVHLHNVTDSTVDMGAGDDHLYISGSIQNSHLLGGSGMDVLNLDGAFSGTQNPGIHSLNLGDLFDNGNSVGGFEVIDLAGGNANLLKISAGDVDQSNLHIDTALSAAKLDAGHQALAGQNILRVTGDAGQDSVQLDSGSWHHSAATTVTYDGVAYSEYTSMDNTHQVLIQQSLTVTFG